MNTEQFESLVLAEIQSIMGTDYPTVPINWENGPALDKDRVGPVWLDVEFRWYAGSFAGMGLNPTDRHSGAISLGVYTRQHEGTSTATAIVDTLGTRLKARRIGEGVLYAPQRLTSPTLLGWHRRGLLVPFTLR